MYIRTKSQNSNGNFFSLGSVRTLTESPGNQGVANRTETVRTAQAKFRCQGTFSRHEERAHNGAAHGRCRGDRKWPRPSPLHRRAGHCAPDDHTPSNSLAGCSPRTFRRQRARRSGSVRPTCSHSGNESRMGSACPAPWQRWLDQVDSHGSATIAARTGLASMYLRTTSRWSPSWMTGDRKRPCQTWPLVPCLRWCRRGPHRVGLDVPQNDEQVVAVWMTGDQEAALPDVAAGSLSPVVPPGVSDGQGL